MSSESRFVSIDENFYAILNVFQDKVYVHIHNRQNRKKRLTMKYEVMKNIFEKQTSFERASEQLMEKEEEEEEDCGSSYDDYAYKRLMNEESAKKKVKTSGHRK